MSSQNGILFTIFFLTLILITDGGKPKALNERFKEAKNLMKRWNLGKIINISNFDSEFKHRTHVTQTEKLRDQASQGVVGIILGTRIWYLFFQ